MTDRPIIFSAESIKAIVVGRKTQSRRVIVPQPDPWDGWQEESIGWDDELGWVLWQNVRPGKQQPIPIRCPYPVGARLWVKETWALAHGEPRWRSPIFMPKARARLWLEVVAVRAERLQDITDADVQAEGFTHAADFARAWDRLNDKRGYHHGTNPFVWVVTFRKLTP